MEPEETVSVVNHGVEMITFADIERIHLNEGDVLVVKSPRYLDPDSVARVQAVFPDNKVIFASHDIEFTVVGPTPEE